MRTALVLVMGFSFGCVHAQRLTPDERCALQGMVLTGMSVSNSSSSDVTVGGGHTYVTSGSIDESSVQCRVPATTAERCAVDHTLKPAAMKLDYNAKIRNLLIGTGYVLFIVPGIVASIAFISGEADLEKEIADLYTATSCDAPVAEAPLERVSRPEPNNQSRKVVEGERPLVCALHRAGDSTGACFVNPADCDSVRDKGSADDFTVCEERRAGACFNATVVLTQERRAICAPSISDCERQLAKARTDPDFEIAATMCGIYRTRDHE